MGAPALLAEMGYPPRLTVDRVSARVPTQQQYEALRLPSDLPVLRTLRVVYSDDDRPIEVTVMAKAGTCTSCSTTSCSGSWMGLADQTGGLHRLVGGFLPNRHCG